MNSVSNLKAAPSPDRVIIRGTVLIFSLFLMEAGAGAAVIHVPQDHAKVQSALNASQPGDEIVVAPGVYRENLKFPGHDLTLRSADALSTAVVAATMIHGQTTTTVEINDPSQNRRVIELKGTETGATVIAGLTIRDGYVIGDGAAVEGNGSMATFEHNLFLLNRTRSEPVIDYAVIVNCSGTFRRNTFRSNEGVLKNCSGTIAENFFLDNEGIAVKSCSGTISGNHFKNNYRGIDSCDGLIEDNFMQLNEEIAIRGCDGEIRRNRIVSNGSGLVDCDGWIHDNVVAWHHHAATFTTYVQKPYLIYEPLADGLGSAMTGCDGRITNNVLADNTGEIGRHGQGQKIVLRTPNMLHDCRGEITNNIFWNHIYGQSTNNEPHYQTLSDCSVPRYSCIFQSVTTETTNIYVNPKLKDRESRQFRLEADSPCIDAGARVVGLTTDRDGNPRGVVGSDEPRGDGSFFDMGAYEFQPPASVAELWESPADPTRDDNDAGNRTVSLQGYTDGVIDPFTDAGGGPARVVTVLSGLKWSGYNSAISTAAANGGEHSIVIGNAEALGVPEIGRQSYIDFVGHSSAAGADFPSGYGAANGSYVFTQLPSRSGGPHGVDLNELGSLSAAWHFNQGTPAFRFLIQDASGRWFRNPADLGMKNCRGLDGIAPWPDDNMAPNEKIGRMQHFALRNLKWERVSAAAEGFLNGMQPGGEVALGATQSGQPNLSSVTGIGVVVSKLAEGRIGELPTSIHLMGLAVSGIGQEAQNGVETWMVYP